MLSPMAVLPERHGRGVHHVCKIPQPAWCPRCMVSSCFLCCLQIEVTAAVANFLVNEARKNFHEPANLLQEQDLLIYNFCPEYTGKVGFGELS